MNHIADIDFAIANKDAKGAAVAAIKAAKAAKSASAEVAKAIHVELRTRLAVAYGAPMVPGGRWAYYRGKTAVYVAAFGAPSRFDLRINHVLWVDEADTDHRSFCLAVSPDPAGLYAFLAE